MTDNAASACRFTNGTAKVGHSSQVSDFVDLGFPEHCSERRWMKREEDCGVVGLGCSGLSQVGIVSLLWKFVATVVYSCTASSY